MATRVSPPIWQTPARVKNRIFLGQQTEYLVESDEFGDILVLASKHAEDISGGFSPGDAVRIGWDDTSALTFEEDLQSGRSTVAATPETEQDGTTNSGRVEP